MPHRIEVGMRPELADAAGASVRARVAEDLGIEVDKIRVTEPKVTVSVTATSRLYIEMDRLNTVPRMVSDIIYFTGSQYLS